MNFGKIEQKCGCNFVQRTITLWVTSYPEDDQSLIEVECMFFVYMIKSTTNGKTYVGSTSQNVERRLLQHNIGSNKWTKANGPFKLVYYESYICKTDALMREKFYKTGMGSQIKKLILENFIVNLDKN